MTLRSSVLTVLATLTAVPVSAAILRERCAWTGVAAQPDVHDVMVSPVVADFDGDGVSDVAFVACDADRANAGTLVAISGADCRELFVVGALGCQRCLDDTTCRELDADGTGVILSPVALAAADLDADGRVEIVAVLAVEHDRFPDRLIAFNADGTFRWCTARVPHAISIFGTPFTSGTPAIADLNADGRPEIVLGARVFDADGALVAQSFAFDEMTTSSVAADADGDGTSEIVIGSAVLDGTATLRWYRPDLMSLDWFGSARTAGSAVADLDGDGAPEIILATEWSTVGRPHVLTVLDGPTGATRAAIDLGGAPAACSDNHGIPSVGDIDGDGIGEIAVASGTELCLYRYAPTPSPALAPAWCAPISDCSSGVLSPSFADVDGDSLAEVLLRDEIAVRVYASDGTVRESTPTSSGTYRESVVAADAGGDCAGELIVAADDILPGSAHRGVRIFEGDAAPLPPYRGIWNQNAYRVGGVNDDGTIPRVELPSRSVRAQGTEAPAGAVITASRTTLWPPNHRMVRLELDAGGTPLRVARVFQDEPTDDLGDGAFAPDAVIDPVDPGSVLLRAERSGRGDGRVYHVEIVAGAGACASTSTVTICVPHDQRGHRRASQTCADEGPLFDATAP